MQGRKAPPYNEPFELIVLGSGTCVPTGDRGPSAYAVRRGERVLLIDMGAGCLEKLARCGISYRNIDGVILSHYHVDHTSELPLLLFANNYSPGYARATSLRIVGPEGLDTFLRDLERLYRWVKPLNYEIIPIEGRTPSATFLGDVVLRSCQAAHGDGRALSVRLDVGGVSITFSGDTGYAPDLVALARDTDLLIIECSYPAGRESEAEGHLTPRTAARIASECRAKKVVLTHLYPEAFHSDPASQFREQAEADVIVAHDLLRITL